MLARLWDIWAGREVNGKTISFFFGREGGLERRYLFFFGWEVWKDGIICLLRGLERRYHLFAGRFWVVFFFFIFGRVGKVGR